LGRKLPLPSGWSLQSVEFWLLFGVTASLILLSWVVWRRTRKTDLARVYLAYGLFSGSLLTQPIQRADLTHVNFVACAILALIPLLVTGIVQQFNTTPAAAVIAALVVSLAILWGQWSLNQPYLQPTSAPVTVNGRTFPVSDPNQAATITWMLGDLTQHAHAGDRLFVRSTDLSRTPLNDTYFSFLLPNLTPATYFLDGSANAPGSRLASDLKTADFVILDDDPS